MQEYELVVGLEMHIQLDIKTKAFAGEAYAFDASPNSLVSPVSLGLPGSLPRINQKAIEQAILLGLAVGGEISPVFALDRKHYFYPDLPKGYQITQYRNPIVRGGNLSVMHGDRFTEIKIHHIHLEEDAGKSMHDVEEDESLIDYNRSGVVLLEFVTEPCIHDPKLVENSIASLRQLVQYLGIGSGDMEKGALRCDCNVSVRPAGARELSTKCEIKNLNSKRFARMAVELEYDRQLTILHDGGQIEPQTLHYDNKSNLILPMREKNSLMDYRYMPEPDIPDFPLERKWINEIGNRMPELPIERVERIKVVFDTGIEVAAQVIEDRQLSACLLSMADMDINPQHLFDLFEQKIKPLCKEKSVMPGDLGLTEEKIKEIIRLIEDDRVSKSLVFSRLFDLIVDHPEASVYTLAEDHGMLIGTDTDSLAILIDEVLHSNAGMARKLQSGHKELTGFFMGEIMRKAPRKPDPRKAMELLIKKLREFQ